ncbi:hypothetical protein CWN94_21725 [Vibrio splendidus]|uniref:hypothetical protein n=1 Tax=Vibrio splendidus TaxID=29497 RepID=UPI000D3D5C12|nr:hypothetical protein [Vibrio splendidus]PTO51383.1 hypothetical protein CWN94_21725 [Vibrio splendidus]
MNFIIDIIQSLPLSSFSANNRFISRQSVLFRVNRHLLMSLALSPEERTKSLSGSTVQIKYQLPSIKLTSKKRLLLFDSIKSFAEYSGMTSRFDTLRVGYFHFYEHNVQWQVDYYFRGEVVDLLLIPFNELDDICFIVTLSEYKEK